MVRGQIFLNSPREGSSRPGGVAEWSNALVLKTSEPQGSESSNLSPSAGRSIGRIGAAAVEAAIVLAAADISPCPRPAR